LKWSASGVSAAGWFLKAKSNFYIFLLSIQVLQLMKAELVQSSRPSSLLLNHLAMRSIIYGTITLLMFMLVSCQRSEPCQPLQGTWTSSEGQKLVFAEGGKAALITYFGMSSADTFFANVAYTCDNSPGMLDLLIDTMRNVSFKYHLFGLIAWSGDSVFSLHLAKGRDASVRPKAFDLQEAKRFRRE
jgi:hypothetical protein